MKKENKSPEGFKVQLESAKLQRIRDSIIEMANPQKIILFGSRAEFKATEKSDVDLLVVVDNHPGQDIKLKLASELSKDIGFRIQIIPITSERYEETKDVIGGIAYPATKYGVVIYEKP